MLVLSCLGALQLVACLGLALREALRAGGADRLVMGGLVALLALFTCGALAGL